MNEEKDQLESLIKLFSDDKIDETIDKCHIMINQSSKSPILYNILGVSYFSKKKYELSIQYIKKAIKLKPSYKDAYNNLGLVLKEVKKINKAIFSFQKAITLDPDFYEAHLNLGVTLMSKNRINDAEKVFLKAIKIEPKKAEVFNNLGIIKRYQGNFSEAKNYFKLAIKSNKYFTLAYRNLSLIKTFKTGDNEIIEMMNMYNTDNLKPEERKDLCFGLGKAFEDLKNYKKSFSFYKEGNDIKKRLINYDINNEKKLLLILKNKFTNNSEITKFKFQKSSKIPIFILGMPRSGTTLIEQIITSHSKVHGGGELNYVGQLVNDLNLVNSRVDFKKYHQFQTMYLKKISEISKVKNYVTDKNVHNFKWIGFILNSIANAKIVHVKRKSEAICWSNYKHHLNGDANGFCYDLDQICNFYKIYNELIDFWIDLFPKKIYTINYDKLVNNQYQETENLLLYLGLKFESSCIEFYKNKRIVKTASTVMVRNKVYKDSSYQWEKYDEFLKPYFRNL